MTPPDPARVRRFISGLVLVAVAGWAVHWLASSRGRLVDGLSNQRGERTAIRTNPKAERDANVTSPLGPPEWSEFRSTEGRFAILLPGRPAAERDSQTTSAGPIDIHVFSVEGANARYLVGYADYPSALAYAPVDQALTMAGTSAAASVRGRILSQHSVTIESYPGREFVISVPEGKARLDLAVFLVGSRLYQVGLVSNSTISHQQELQRLYRSFRLL